MIPLRFDYRTFDSAFFFLYFCIFIFSMLLAFLTRQQGWTLNFESTRHLGE